MPKRALDDLDAGGSSSSPTPAKRFHSSAYTTPARSQSSSDFLFSTPYTPYSFSIPSDSPTNPFGRHRHMLPLTLPKATSFGKHMALRFQVARSPDLDKPKSSKGRSAQGKKRKAPARRRDPDTDDEEVAQAFDTQGTYRIVQVPRSYTFRHLRALLLFLFGGDPDPNAQKRRAADDPGHLFEVQRGVVMHTYGNKPGQVKTGKTWAKLSSVQDPLCAESFVELAGRADEPAMWLGDEKEGEEWTWENEEDFTIGHAWPDGGELRRAIVYHHDADTTIHITVNTQSVPKRKGVGNKPFVFRAFGEIQMDPWYTPPPPREYGAMKRVAGSRPLRFTRRRRAPTPPDGEENRDDTAEADEAGNDTEADDEEEEEEEEDWDGGLDTRTWNWCDAFSHFLARASPPAAITASSSQSSPIRPGSSSDAPDEWDETLSDGDRSMVSTYSSSSPFRLPLVTPAPALALTRFRNERTQRKIERLTRKEMDEADRQEKEGEEARKAEERARLEKLRAERKAAREVEKAEVDQLDGDEEDREERDRSDQGDSDQENEQENDDEEDGEREITWEECFRPLRHPYDDDEV
ncbi:hypothetical protein DENSPDRAFT_932818 [Dentipellis sp. KUC8613]|nr:hypothetical protein DENSPDRAFT_932818 [Dentipellis sp. KUC8613]